MEALALSLKTALHYPFRKGWRTVALNALIVLFGVLETADVGDLLPPSYAQFRGPLTMLIGMVGIWLRTQTNTPVGKR